ncbi:uncharacterized protein LOC129379911 [Poeciliopsis prolifica]|uniref:uncharacterized protein LOC129379911 n=1 Tax=Poeciliopsis prolifica TaxID=188132 RepID=UPI002414028B|nr:uncharacterized protein LOC129379911 [Poeciliopsis prolifica]
MRLPVDPAAPSCTAGEYLPRFLPPTPEHGAQFFIDLDETIEISIRAEATQSVGSCSSVLHSENLPSLKRTESFTMLLFVLLVAIIGWTEAGYYGLVLSHTTKDVQGNTFTVVRRLKASFTSCAELESWWSYTNKIDESSGEWCLGEYTLVDRKSFYSSYSGWNTGAWINNRNGISSGLAKIFIEGRFRSDINRSNSSPLTGILPVMRVPSNCQRNINLLTFDPDGDHVQCRHGSGSNECYTCTPPSVLSLSPACSLSFSPTSSNNEGLYAVQLMMEDFPRQTINLTDSKDATESRNSSISMTRMPVQFVFKVDPAAPSCTAGEYLPRFLPPTPEHGAQFFIDVNEMIEISIRAEATQSVITGILFNGPFNMTKSSSGSGYFTLRWTPSFSQNDESHPVCFAVQATASSSVYQSELRCVIVRVGNIPFIATPSPPPKTSHVKVVKLKIKTSMSLKDKQDEMEKAIRDQLITGGLPADIKVHLLSFGIANKTAAP